MPLPTISVALPVRNGANYLREALNSILCQDFREFELLVSDNASTDDTPSILADYAAQDNRLRVSRSDALLTQADNVNRAIGLAKSDWVALFCHDDIMQPNCLRAVSEAIRTTATGRVGLIGCGDAWLFANGYSFRPPNPQAGQGPTLWHGKDLLVHSLSGRPADSLPALTGATVRRAAWEQAGGFDNSYIHFDTFFWTRLMTSWDFVKIHEPLATTRIHRGQVAAHIRKNLRSVRDHRQFWPWFLQTYQDDLDLPLRTRARVRAKPMGVAGTTIAAELMCHRPVSGARLALKMPIKWWPVIPFFVVRSLIRERRRIGPLLDHVPPELIYP